MMVLLRGAFSVLCLSLVAVAIPLSLIEDSKALSPKSQPSNKVKRAQEVLMFGNQQNRGSDTRAYGLPRTEKRAASDVDDNTLSDVATLPNILPQIEENSYDTNQLDLGRMPGYDKSYQYVALDLPPQLPKAGFRDQLYNDPALSELGLYGLVDARRKREAKVLKSLRYKRDLDLSPEDLLPLLKFLEAERRQKLHDQRLGWPAYEPDDYELGDTEDNDIDDSADYLPPGGRWLDGPVSTHRSNEFLLPRQHKRFMVSKRRPAEESILPMYTNPGHIPVYRRLVL